MAMTHHTFGPTGDRCSGCGADLWDVMDTENWDCIEQEGDRELLRGLSLVDWTRIKQTAVDILWANTLALADTILQDHLTGKYPAADDAIDLAEGVRLLSVHFTDLPYVVPLPTPWKEHMATLREKVPGKD